MVNYLLPFIINHYIHTWKCLNHIEMIAKQQSKNQQLINRNIPLRCLISCIVPIACNVLHNLFHNAGVRQRVYFIYFLMCSFRVSRALGWTIWCKQGRINVPIICQGATGLFLSILRLVKRRPCVTYGISYKMYTLFCCVLVCCVDEVVMNLASKQC